MHRFEPITRPITDQHQTKETTIVIIEKSNFFITHPPSESDRLSIDGLI